MVEGDAGPQAEVPDLCPIRGLPAFGQITGDRPIGHDLHEVVVDTPVEAGAGPACAPGTGVEIVILRGVLQPEPHEAAGLWLL